MKIYPNCLKRSEGFKCKKLANTLCYNEPKKLGENIVGHQFTADQFDFT